MKKMDTQFLTPPQKKPIMINVSNEPSDAHKISLKEEIMEEVTEKLMEKILNIVNEKAQDALKKFQDIMDKELEKTQKQLNVLKEDVNKHKSKTKETKKREIYEIKRTRNIKEQLKKK
jgi:hypothetical protein